MSTQKQIEANRRNAAKSTGPRSDAGKAKSRLNALKHGVYANSPVIPGEKPADYKTLAESFFERFQPATPEEHTLVATLIRTSWFLERFVRIEVDLWERRFAKDEDFRTENNFPIANAFDVVSKSLDPLQRRADTAERTFRRSLELLLKLQAQRNRETQPENGFVPPKPPKPAVQPTPAPVALPNRSEPSLTPVPLKAIPRRTETQPSTAPEAGVTLR